MKNFKLPDIDRLPRVCARCLGDETGKDLDELCKHRFMHPVIVTGLVVTDTFGMTSEVNIKRFLSEGAWNASAYAVARILTVDEARAIRDGRACLSIAVVPS